MTSASREWSWSKNVRWPVVDKPIILRGQIAGAALLADGDWTYRVRVTREEQAAIGMIPALGDAVTMAWMQPTPAQTGPGTAAMVPPPGGGGADTTEPEAPQDAPVGPRTRTPAEQLHSGGLLYLPAFLAYLEARTGHPVPDAQAAHEAVKKLLHLPSLGDMQDDEYAWLKKHFLEWKRTQEGAE